MFRDGCLLPRQLKTGFRFDHDASFKSVVYKTESISSPIADNIHKAIENLLKVNHFVRHTGFVFKAERILSNGVGSENIITLGFCQSLE